MFRELEENGDESRAAFITVAKAEVEKLQAMASPSVVALLAEDEDVDVDGGGKGTDEQASE